MIETSVHLELEQPPEVVFDKMADVRNDPQWNPMAKSAEKTSEGSIGQGTTFHCKYGGGVGELEMRIVEAERPSKLAIEGQARMLTMHFTGKLSPQGSGTRFDGRMGIEPRGAAKLMTPLMRMSFRRNVDKAMQRFKRWVEGKPVEG